MIETLDANLFYWSTPPLKPLETAKHSAEDKRVFLFEHLLNVGYRGSTKTFPWLTGASHAQTPYIQMKTAIGPVQGVLSQRTRVARLSGQPIAVSALDTLSLVLIGS
jgi:hypothetical protein